jgi:phosphoglycerol transferase MdoB-like AlkP superfamily enzyme
MTKKLPNLPALPRVFKNAGYRTTLLHGGDLTVFHKSDYYLTVGHDTLVSQKDLPNSWEKCKWGIHDGYTFEWLYDDIQKKTQNGERWFTTFQTLSSHETFEVPYNRIPNDKIANSYAYVDDCFGKFIDKLKTTPAWKDLLVVCVGDHGCNYGEPLSRSEYPHIPILFIGGAVGQAMQINTIMSQTDLAATLLGQLDLPHENFIFSRDVLADTYTYPFSFHTYNNGFLFRDATGYTNYDNVSNTVLKGADERREKLGKVILQTLYADLSKR